MTPNGVTNTPDILKSVELFKRWEGDTYTEPVVSISLLLFPDQEQSAKHVFIAMEGIHSE
jgi:hypothetical protein